MNGAMRIGTRLCRRARGNADALVWPLSASATMRAISISNCAGVVVASAASSAARRFSAAARLASEYDLSTAMNSRRTCAMPAALAFGDAVFGDTVLGGTVAGD